MRAPTQATPAPRAVQAPFAVPADEVLAALGSSADGLSAAQADQRLAQWGPNAIPRLGSPGVLRVFVRQFASPLIYVLIFAAGLSLALGEQADAVFIAAVLLLNAVIGTVEEYQAQRGAESLQSMIRTRAGVVRDGEEVELDATEVTVGDIVLVSSGNVVPADLRLVNSLGLQVDESALTGESAPVAKRHNAPVETSAALADRPTMAYAGTMVTYGRGRGVVTAIGGHTVFGSLAGQLQAPSQAEPPLVRSMRRFTARIGLAVIVAAAVMATIELLRGTAWHEVLLIAVALAVSVIPEGLPVALTVALAVAVRRMARRNVVVRRLVAIESLGSCTMIATDKTGTLTVNQLTASSLLVPGCEPWTVTGTGTDPVGTLVIPEGEDDARLAAAERLALAGVLCSEAVLAHRDDRWVHHGSAVDVALLVLGHKLGMTREQALRARPLLDHEPFESDRRYAATLHAVNDERAEVVVKGAVERIVAMSGSAAGLDGPQPLDAEATLAAAERLAAGGHRVIAVAVGVAPRPADDQLDAGLLRDLTFYGLVGMIDPPRPEVATAIAACRRAGIEVAMVTGDHPATATAVATAVGLGSTERPLKVVSGTELARAEDAGAEGVDSVVAATDVFARVEPAQKLTIVQSLIRQGKVVAVTGDGVNDAPALHHAHVGIAMGASGTDVARDAAELVVTDDQFTSIAAGVEEGRVAYANVRKVVQLLITTGAGELVLILGALTLGLPLPLLAVQLLWLNLVTNGIQDVALAFEPAEGDEMRRPPRDPGDQILNRLMIERVLISALVIGGVTLAAYRWMLAAGWSIEAARNTTVLLMVLFENVQVLNTRSERLSTFRQGLWRNPLLIVGTAMAQLIHIGALYLPVTQDVLGLAPVPLTHWLSLVALALTLLVAVELHKAWWRVRVSRRREVPPARRPGASGR